VAFRLPAVAAVLAGVVLACAAVAGAAPARSGSPTLSAAQARSAVRGALRRRAGDDAARTAAPAIACRRQAPRRFACSFSVSVGYIGIDGSGQVTRAAAAGARVHYRLRVSLSNTYCYASGEGVATTCSRHADWTG
jgi:hypothetical protein